MKDVKDLDVDIPTMIRTIYDRGRVLNIQGEMWLLRTVPMQPVLDARTERDRFEAFQPLWEAINEISALTTVLKDTREIARKNYRRIKIKVVDIPQVFRAPATNSLKEYQDTQFADQIVHKRVLMLAVKMVDRIGGGGGFKDQLNSLADSLAQNAVPLSDYDWDFERLDSAFRRCGLGIPTIEEIRACEGWWNLGQHPDVHYLPHPEHLHFFRTEQAALAADRAGTEDCEHWPKISGHSIMSIATVDGFDIGNTTMPATDDMVLWAAELMLQDIAAISINALVEPPKVTRNQLRRKRTTFKNDQEEHAKSGKMDRIESQAAESALTAFEDIYATGGGSPTLVETSILVAFNGLVEDMDMIKTGIASLRPMASRQRQAFAEMMLCSPVKSNPAVLDLPTQTVACSGIQTLNTVGDTNGALLGFTEHDRQPAYIDPERQSHEDSSPISVNLGGTGSGKRLALSTLVPTPQGYRSLGDLTVGDSVYHRAGGTATITGESEVAEEPDLYLFSVSDGQTLKADYEHQWVVSGPSPKVTPETIQSLVQSAAKFEGKGNLQEIYVKANEATGGFYRSAEAVRAALAMVDVHPTQDHPVRFSTALAGLALRLGQRANGDSLLKADEQMLSTGEILAEGAKQFRIRATAPILGAQEVKAPLYALGRAVAEGLPWAIDRLAELLVNAAPAQKLQLIQGIADVSASIKHGAVFLLKDQYTADAAANLLRSIGMVASEPMDTEEGWVVRCDAVVSLFTDPQKQLQCEFLLPRDQWLDIVEVTPIPSEPAKCITVDSPDGTYLVEGFIPTHNTQVLLWKATQYAMMGNDSVIIDPKPGSDHSPIVKKFGGNVFSLDELRRADGVFDPIRFSPNPQVGAEIATSMITSIYPWPRDGQFNYEVDTQRAIAYGVSRGANCTGQALLLAKRDNIVAPQVIDEILKLSDSSPMFRAIVGTNPAGEGLRISKGLTLIMVGDNHLELPQPSQMSRPETLGVNQKVNLALVRMMVFGTAMALTGRDGTLHLDEAWMFLGAGAQEVERLGRLARSQRVLPELYTQKVTDALEAKIQAYISRGLILHLPDEEEAIAACKLFKLEPTPARIARITTKDLKGAGQHQTVNYESLKALRDPYTHEVVRGSVAIYSDMGGRALPVEIVLPKAFLALSSTNARDMDLRDGKLKS